MTIWAIADIHASRTDPATGSPQKPMDIFGEQWSDHVNRVEDAWQRLVADGDTVIIAGDIDWAMHLEDAMESLHRIAGWRGEKILLRGNHDYWWSSKTTGKVRAAMPLGMRVLHNCAFIADGYNICGTKGSPVPGASEWTPQDEKLLRREEQRLQASLHAADASLPTIAALHYPPFYPAHGGSPFREAMERGGVTICVYGHLHGEARSMGPEGKYDGVDYRPVAADAVGFSPVALVSTSPHLPCAEPTVKG